MGKVIVHLECDIQLNYYSQVRVKIKTFSGKDRIYHSQLLTERIFTKEHIFKEEKKKRKE